MKYERLLAVAMLIHAGASLFHFSHNAHFLADYPNLPPSLTAAGIYGTWLLIAGIGFAGWLLLKRGHHFWGLAVIAVYATLGFDGLLHYTLAPMGAHSQGMNLSIWSEVVTAAVLLLLVLMRLGQRLR